MREVEHSNLFKPPEGVRIIVVPVSGEYHPKGKTMMTPMKGGYAELALSHYKALSTNVAILMWQRGVTPHPLTYERDGRIKIPGKKKQKITGFLRHHLVSLPTRAFAKTAIQVEYLCSQLRALNLLVDGRIPWLAEGDIVLPQICDDPSIPGAEKHDWSYFKPYVETWLADERFVVISGKEGKRT